MNAFTKVAAWALICIVFYGFWSFINVSIDVRDWGSWSRFFYGFGFIWSFIQLVLGD